MNLCKISAHAVRRYADGLSVVLMLLILSSLNVQAQQPSSSEAAQPAQQTRRASKNEKDSPDDKTAGANGSTVNGSAQTKGEGNRLLNFFRKTTVEGFTDLYFGYNFNRPAGHANALRSFDTRDRRYSLNMASIGFVKEPTADSRIGFRLNLIYGPAADFLNTSEPGGLKFYKNVQRAYLSYLAPVGEGLRLDAGKFGPWAGAEEDAVMPNWNYSRSLLYTLAQPSFHTGVKATYVFKEKVTLLGAIVNGWGNVEENNRGKTYGFALTLNPTAKLSLTQSYTVGPEQPDDTRHRRHLLDTILSYKFDERFSVMGNYDYGLERLDGGSSVRWQGFASYFRYQITKRIAFSPRFEIYYDYDGFTSGTEQKLKEITLTGEYKFSKHLLTRLEYRRDWSNQPVFERADPTDFARTQATVVGGMIWSFSTRDEETDDANEAQKDSPSTSTSQVNVRESQSHQENEKGRLSSQPNLLPALRAVSIKSINVTDALPRR